MSPFKKINSPMDFIPGIHGILLKNKGRQAIFLPQVAPEQGWDRETTLVNLCRKAWLPDNAWQEDSCEFFIYTAQVFEE
jgi:AMMECR1 domain-containing protein